MSYSWFLDVYSQHGVRIFEIRNSKYVPEDSKLYAELLEKIKRPNLQAVPQEQPHAEQVPAIEPTVQVKIVDFHPQQQQKAHINFAENNKFGKLLASRVAIEVALDQKPICT